MNDNTIIKWLAAIFILAFVVALYINGNGDHASCSTQYTADYCE